MIYSVSFPEWQYQKRLKALQRAGFSVIMTDYPHSIDLRFNNMDAFGSGHTEVAKFICDPVYNPKMWILDTTLCKIVNELHHEFWCWKNKSFSFNVEEEIVKGIKEFLAELDCKEQDKWLEVTPDQLKEKITNDYLAIFNAKFWWDVTAGKYVCRNLSIVLDHADSIDWTLIHSQLFQP